MQHIVSRGHSRPLTEITFVNDDTPKNTLLVSASHDKCPQVRNGETGDWIGSFTGHKGAVWSSKIDSLTRTLALTGSGDFTAKLWCATTGKEICEMKHRHVVKTVDFSNDTEKFVTGCQDGILRVYNTCSPEVAPLQLVHTLHNNGAADPITRVHWGDKANNNMIILGRRSGHMETWDLRCCGGDTAKPTVSKKIMDQKAIIDIELNSSGGTANGASCIWTAVGKEVVLLSMTDLSKIRSYIMPEQMNFNEEGGVSVSPTGRTFMAGASDLWLREFDMNSGDVLRTFKGHHGPIRSVRYHPGGQMVASGSEDATIRLWSL